jgi:hypothetical protein
LGDLPRTSLTKQKKADRFCGEEPDVAIVAIRSPAGFISVLDRGLPIGFDQLGENGTKKMGHAMKTFDEASRIDLQLFTDAPQRNSVQVVHDRRISHQLIAVEVFREHSGGRRLEGAPTLGAIAFGEPIDQWFSPKRTTFHHEPLGVAFIHEWRATLRAEVS